MATCAATKGVIRMEQLLLDIGEYAQNSCVLTWTVKVLSVLLEV